MKQEEKTKLSYDKILSAATGEFGNKGFENASLNTICSENRISKGLVYHNFKNKDELYLRCIERCYAEMTSFLQGVKTDSGNAKENLKRLLGQRQKFFEENPCYGSLFFQTIVQPPKHLLTEIQQIRAAFDEFNRLRYTELLKQLELRNGITIEAALEYFITFQEMFNGYFQGKSYTGNDFNTIMEDHEMKLSKLLDVMLFGIAKEDGTI